ncbi:hypothetical protein EDB87DRAFT_889121 [Lactarius vividus]|nr:hypothetical protein EDB87DRAFT_889121 [Lactarius vividus]
MAVPLSSPSSSSSPPQQSSKISPQLSPLQGFRTPTSPWPPRGTPRTVSLHTSGTEEPDELFTKFTVSEVKQVHNRLLSDADAKQEELRLMVGERYRDLLQASSSIISIAQSSRDVLSALEDIKTSIPAELPRSVRRTSATEKGDTQLRILQSVAAHMKLLLDTPEHIWRLLEKKKYLHAGWLFLLARIIYQALVRTDTEDEEDDWRAQGIDVLEQFPLVQRQWDTVSQLRAQITYKATLSLRDSSASLEDVCSILLTLHLLESRPLIDVLTIFLAQRTRNLQTTLSRNPKSAPNGSLPNGSTLPKFKKVIVREVREGLEAVLEAISSTVGIARAIFSNRSDDSPSLMSRILLFIQSDIPVPDTSLPSELQMSTQHLLSTLPSASHFTLLPSSIRSYRPYVDLASATSSIPPAQIALQLSEWFSKAVTNLQNAAEGWFTDLRTLKEVWAVRSWFNEWLGGKELEDGEKRGLAEVIDGVAHGQAVKILRRALGNLQDRFRDELQDALSQLRDGTSLAESTPTDFLFQPVVPPTFDISLGSTLVSTFRKYESTLQRQVTTRTPLLHKIVCSLEDGAKALRDDSDGKLTGRLRDAYAPLVEDCCKAILAALSSNVAELKSGTDTDIRSLAFVSRLTETLHASPFDSDLGCDAISNNINFRGGISALREQSVTQWRGFVVSTVSADYLKTSLHARSRSDLSCQPSSSLMHALLSLSSYVHSVEIPSSYTTGKHKRGIAESVIRHFVATLVDTLEASEELRGAQASIWDLKFLRRLLALWTSDWDGLLKLDKLIEQVRSSRNPTNDEGSLLEQHILRTQILLAPLLPLAPSHPPKSSSKSSAKDTRTESLLLFGVPPAEQATQPVMDLVKPGPRFGSLLVGSTPVAR